ncbi:integrase [Labrys sp. ZIDIC5]|uniref:integrase n=1 Tax=Labrys sedimenti TaxID=3106036 RepID=UPI002ACA1605|nr:integrase [Labrys sp. ZIDIC5]MDZ5454441.1 integrase [Labrys sp. ZIDIC5]
MAREIKAPGLEWRRRKGMETPYWIAPKRAVKAGFTPKSANLGILLHDPERLIARCKILTMEAATFLNTDECVADPWDGTISGMLKLYEFDQYSTFHELGYASRQSYLTYMRKLHLAHGKRRIDDIIGRDLAIWHKMWTNRPDGKTALAAGRTTIAALKAAARHAVACRKPGAVDFREVLRAFRCPSLAPRKQVISRQEVVALRQAAHVSNAPSRALATALQFDGLLRLYDVIGQWIPLDDPRPSAVQSRGRKWFGLRWEDIDQDFILRIIRAKTRNTTGAETVIPLRFCPMVMGEMATIPEEKRTGPLIVNEATGLPYDPSSYRRAWRQDAILAGIPKDKLARDLRASGNTEARGTGATTDDLAKVAAHSPAVNRRVYDRAAIEAFERVAKARAKKIEPT